MPLPDLSNVPLVMENALSSPEDIAGWRMEGDASVTFEEGRMRMQNNLDPKEGQRANFVFWCDRKLPASVAISWEWRALREPGLCILFFSAKGHDGKDLFDLSLVENRWGEYRQYNRGEMDAYHISYFRRKNPTDERSFHTCNLRKSYGFHMVAQGADPLPSVEDQVPPYRLLLVKKDNTVSFFINELPVLYYEDGEEHGPVLQEGYIGFRQMAPLVAEYSKLKVWDLTN